MKNPRVEKTERRKIEVTEDAAPNEAGSGSPNDGAAATPAADVEQNDDPTAGLQADLDRFRDLALRSQADFDNYKKRAAREKEEAIKYANSSLLERLIPVVDNFQLGLSAAKSESEQSPIFAGMSMVLKQLTDFLADNGLQPIDAEGQKFDPNLHEAIAHEPNEQLAEGTVIRQIRRGYRLKDRLLRPSTVIVSSGAKKSDE